MKRSDLKELIKKSMLEVSPTSGAMTPEEEKMVADYEEEEANKYALDKEEPMEEDILREADEIVAAYAEKKTVKEVTGPMDRPLNVGDTIDMGKVDPTTVMISKTYSNLLDYHRSLVSTITKTHPEVAKDQKIISYFNGINTVLKDLKKYLDTQSKINEEMHGGYLELLEMNPAFEEGVASLLEAWNEWKEGPETEPEMVEEAKHDILAYLSSMMN